MQNQVIALNALRFLALDEDRLARFLSISGLTLQTLKERAGEPAFLIAVMEYLMSDESLLLVFCAEQNLDPGAPARALAGLSGDMRPC